MRKRKRRSVPLMVTGIILTSLGGVGAIVGLFNLSAAESGSCSYSSSYDSDCVDETQQNVGIGLAVAGLAMLGAGIPMTIVGAAKVPVEPGDETSFVPELTIGPTSGTLRWRF